jgi:ATP-dependent helicase/nuclease subunit A
MINPVPDLKNYNPSENQRIASDPSISSWVSASAGSGKTKVLIDRMLRLLLPQENGFPGTPPYKILALTFTKAAANEMAIRLSQRLSEWAIMPEEKLRQDMQENLLGRKPRPEELTAARRLFARVGETPGGLKIMTIHAFCQSILGRFPIEAELPPGFKPLEEQEALELLTNARKNILSYAAKNPATPLAIAVQNISTSIAENELSDVLCTMSSERNQFQAMLERTFGTDGLYTNLCRFLDVRPGLTEEDAFAEFCNDLTSSVPALYAARKKMAEGNGTDANNANTLQCFLEAQPQQRLFLYDAYRSIFLTTEGNIRKNLAGPKLLKAYFDLADTLQKEAERVKAYEEKRKSIGCAKLTHALFLFGQAVLEEYQKLKDQTGALDYDDLILRTLRLFRGESGEFSKLGNISGWIHYKIDEGIDHLLVDEAQDTNPEQWEIIRLIAEEFFSGSSARDILRTVFVVGDEKQSIFGFQRAAPDKFQEMQEWFRKQITNAQMRFIPVQIVTSFRSTQIVLDSVDYTFMNSSARNLIENYASHTAYRQGHAGLVEIWPLISGGHTTDEESGKNKPSAWILPDRIVEKETGSLKMARRISNTIKGWIDNKETLPSRGRPIQARDIMVLLRTRCALMPQLVRELKQNNIAVSGIDRMVLTEQISVQDLCSAATFALLPEDNLALAGLLKSPFINISEDRLLELAAKRDGTLWNQLKKDGESTVTDWLLTLIANGSRLKPYEFFSCLLQFPCPANNISGLCALKTRLGEDILDPVEEFISQALAYETSHTPSLHHFLKWHEKTNGEIKRQMEETGNVVRIMTVHASKGLQAPIIFLPDTVRSSSVKRDKIYWPHKTGLSVPMYFSSAKDMPALGETVREKLDMEADAEYRRLMYVAMTRAEDRLYIGGYYNKNKPSRNMLHWYDEIRAGLEQMPSAISVLSGIQDKEGVDIPVLRWESTQLSDPVKKDKKIHYAVQDVSVPDWAVKTALPEKPPFRKVQPSHLPSESDISTLSPIKSGNQKRFIRGILTHQLLQLLPSVSIAGREEAGRRFLASQGLLPVETVKDVLKEVMKILEHPDYRDLFGPDSGAEIPVSGIIFDNTMISGQIDRLVVREKDVLIIDYKTNRPPPQKPENVSNQYLKQMLAYKTILSGIYPDKEIRTLLLWTDGPHLMEVSV